MQEQPNASNVGSALRHLADTWRQEKQARLTYQGDDWDKDGQDYTKSTIDAWDDLYKAMDAFTDLLARA